MDLNIRKPVSGASNKARPIRVSLATETSYKIGISLVASLDMILSKERMTKVLISLCRCAGWSAPLLFANSEDRFSRVKAHIIGQLSFLLFFQHGVKCILLKSSIGLG